MDLLNAIMETLSSLTNLFEEQKPKNFDLSTFFSALSALGLFKLFEFFYNEYIRNSENSKSDKLVIDTHLDPLLKSADEFVGKAYSLAKKDYSTLENLPTNRFQNNDYISLYYLLAKFWGNIEIINREGLSVTLANNKEGENYLDFVDNLQSRKVRLVDRITQRAIGEFMIRERNNKLETIPFIDFYNLVLKNDPNVMKWGNDLSDFLFLATHKTQRHKLIIYSTLIHALTDALDPENKVTKDRPINKKKQSYQTAKIIKEVLNREKLKFITNQQKYYRNKPRNKPHSNPLEIFNYIKNIFK